MRAHILSIGSELILGHLTDTNATFLAQELVALGIELLHVTQVGDDRSRIARTIRAALSEAELVICTGGVGPTEDDLTRESIADVAGETPAVDPGLLATIEAFFAARGLVMPERNRKQAWLIPSAEPLPNPVGTAPGWFVRLDGRLIVAMPGVPREMTRMWREQVVPRLAGFLPHRSVRSITLRTVGIGESAVEQLLDNLVKCTNPVVATYAKDDGVQVRITAIASAPDEAEAMRDRVVQEVRRRLARHIYGTDDVTLPAALLDLLRKHGLTIAIADRGAGGRFASLLLSEPSSRDVLLDSTAAGPAETTALDLARLARERSGAGAGLGILMVARPDGPVWEGTVHVGVAGSPEIEERFPMRSAYDEIQRRSALMAADVLRRWLLDRS
ncbi:MAG: CinA-like protein [Thermomicrobiales bacterium]|nr:MAG: CinA-like protein [Thermomicrobiales bacterium]